MKKQYYTSLRSWVSPSQKKFVEKEAKRQYITQSAVIRGLIDTAMAIAKDLK